MLLEVLEVFQKLVLKLIMHPVSLQTREKRLDVLVWSAKSFLNTTLLLESIGVLPAKIIFNNTVTDNHVPQDDLGPF
jgi:hypothetical protein